MAHTTRKWFSMLVLTALIAALPVIASAAVDRSYASGGFYLELDGMLVGQLKSSEGGMPFADVVVSKMGADPILRKQITSPRYSDITVTFGMGMGKPLFQWMQDTLANKYSRKNGAIVYTDFDHNEKKRLTFNSALISEIGFPVFDGASKEPAYFTLKFSPEFTRPEKGKGGKVVLANVTQTVLLPANFRLSIAGLDTRKVNKVEALIVKQKVVADTIGESRDYVKKPATLEIPNLVIEMAESSAQSTVDWFTDFLVNGNNSGPAKEKSATLEILDQSMKTPLLTINLNNLGIFKLEPLKTQANADNISRVRASMYCETMQFGLAGK